MPLLLKDATKFALRGQKRQRSEDDKSTAVYPVYINDSSYDFQLVPSGSVDIRALMDPLAIGEGRYSMCMGITEDLHNELLKVESGCSDILSEKHPKSFWQSALRPPVDDYGASIRVKFYDDVQVYDENGEKIKAPKSWRNVRVVPILSIKAWANETSAGLRWNILAVKIAKPEPRAFTFV